MFSVALLFYKKAVQLVPDIEFRVEVDEKHKEQEGTRHQIIFTGKLMRTVGANYLVIHSSSVLCVCVHCAMSCLTAGVEEHECHQEFSDDNQLVEVFRSLSLGVVCQAERPCRVHVVAGGIMVQL